MKKFIYDYSKSELETIITPKFRAKQIFNWLYQKYEDDFFKFSNISKDVRELLDNEFSTSFMKIINIQNSSDGTKKYLFQLNDLHTIETVLIKMKDGELNDDGEIVGERFTICISSQVGCKIGCSFCFTAKGGFLRNLSAGEIVYQVLALKKDNQIPPNKSINVVFMGMGEPLDNFDNVVKSIEILSDIDGLSISKRRQTISTSGVSPKIIKLGELDLGVQIAISLHSVDDSLREELIPLNKAYNIESIIKALKNYPIDTRKRIMFEYLMIKDLNDDINSAKKLVKLLHGIKSKVNLIYFNPHEGSIYQKPDEKSVTSFQTYLRDRGITCTIRESRGSDISAACGQLREQEGFINGCN